jgi:ribosome-associated translation inhibitor RaiA
MNSKQISTELDTLEARRAQLHVELEAARTRLTDARAGLVTGKVKVSSVTEAQSTFTALDEALTELDSRITKRRAELDAALADEKKRALAARDEQLKATRARLQSEHDADATELDASINAFTARALARSREFHAAGREIFSHLPEQSRASLMIQRSWDEGLKYPALQSVQEIASAVSRAAREADRHRVRGIRAA